MMKGHRLGNKKTHGRACYAAGGRVGEDISDDGAMPIMGGGSEDMGMDVEGGRSKPRLDRASKKNGTTVNIIVTSGGKPELPPPPMPMGPPMGGPPPMPPPGPPMPPMRASGGRVNMKASAAGGLGRLEKIKDYGKNAGKPAKGS